MDLSIIIPALNESRKIESDILAAADFLNGYNLTGEIIIVDDGSHDGTTVVAEKVNISVPGVEKQVIYYPVHRGKGYALRTGIMDSKGDYVLFADSGLNIPYKYAMDGYLLLTSGKYQLAHGSRKLPESLIIRRQNLFRRISSRMFRLFTLYYIHIPYRLSDTQCGFKLYRGDCARTLYSKCQSDGFMFDIEIILLAYQHQYTIAEFPVEWRCDPDSRLHPIRNMQQNIKELRVIKKRFSSALINDH
jgi:dolichyl-phosphate beta-glucosyltransferase